METCGWLFDLYPLGDHMVLWFLTPEGKALRLEDTFPYTVYLGGRPGLVRRAVQALGSRGWLARAYPSRARELASGEEIPVFALELRSYAHLSPLRTWLGKQQGLVEVYNCDLDVAAYYLYRRRLWPCAWYEVEAREGKVVSLAPREEQFARDFSLPPLAILGLGLTRDPLIPLERGNGVLLRWEGRTLELEAADPRTLLRELGRWLQRVDPDLLLSDWGDEHLIPPLWQWSRETGVPLFLDREPQPPVRRFLGGRTYFSYGRVVYQGQAAPCYGRWHVDRRNSFFFREADLWGLVQISRLGQLPLQQAARASPGTLITSMQLARAVAQNILIPWRKADPERFKSAGELLTVDKGGLVFQPPVGLFTEVAELDFASMYPTIMALHNISPETVNCRCCGRSAAAPAKGSGNPPLPSPAGAEGAKAARPGGQASPFLVPEAGYHLCRKREGLVPQTLRPILALREALKAAAKEAPPEQAALYEQRQTALKWMLVTCFGYLGYKNARFGRIEAHEAVTAFGREKLLTAKELCEAAGYRVLHGMTDCLWIQRQGLREEELEELCRQISRVTGVKLALEGIYRWLAFLPSRQHPGRPVATRYFGVFQDGRLKARGLLSRRHDTPPLVRRAQEALLARLAAAESAPALAALRPELEELAEGFRQELRQGGVPAADLVITQVLSRPLRDFRVETPACLALRRLEEAGITVRPGEKIRYVHQEKKGPKELRVRPAPFLEELEGYDTKVYLDLLERAIEEVLTGVFGQEAPAPARRGASVRKGALSAAKSGPAAGHNTLWHPR